MIIDCKSCPELSLMFHIRDVEAHGKGIYLYKTRSVERFAPRFLSRYGQASAAGLETWCCPDARTTDFFQFCCLCWSVLRDLVRTGLVGGPSGDSATGKEKA